MKKTTEANIAPNRTLEKLPNRTEPPAETDPENDYDNPYIHRGEGKSSPGDFQTLHPDEPTPPTNISQVFPNLISTLIPLNMIALLYRIAVLGRFVNLATRFRVFGEKSEVMVSHS